VLSSRAIFSSRAAVDTDGLVLQTYTICYLIDLRITEDQDQDEDIVKVSFSEGAESLS